MARIRTIKPEFFTSLTIADLSLHARLTFIGLWTHVDDSGRCVDDSRLIKAAVWPLDDRVSADVERDLRELSEASLIVRYEAGERSYLAVRTWDEHQRINRPTKSKLPAPPSGPPAPRPPGRKPNSEASRPAETASEPDRSEPSATTHAPLTEGSREERKGKEGNREGNNPSALAPLDAAAADVVHGEIVTTPPALFVVPDHHTPTSTDLATTEPTNAGHINRQWIDYCTANQIKLTNSHIKRYGAAIKRALGEGFDPELVKRALAQMLADRVTSRPALFDNYLIRAQQGPEMPPRRMSRTEEAITRNAPAGLTAGQLVRDALTRPA